MSLTQTDFDAFDKSQGIQPINKVGGFDIKPYVSPIQQASERVKGFEQAIGANRNIVGDYFTNLWNQYTGIAKELPETFKAPQMTGTETPTEVIQKTAGQTVHNVAKGVMQGWQAIFAPLTAFGETVVPKTPEEQTAPSWQKDIIRSGASFASLGPEASVAAMGITGAFHALNAGLDYFKVDPKVKEDVNNVAGTVLSLMGGIAGKKGMPTEEAVSTLGAPIQEVPGRVLGEYGETAKKMTDTSQDIYNAITTKSPEKVNQLLTTQFEKGIKPSVVGKGTQGQMEAYQDRAINAVKAITENKPNLKILNEYGEETGKLPTTLKEFTQAIEQTKEKVFEKANEMTKMAGEKGAIVDLTPITEELGKITKDPTIQDLNPEIVKYVDARIKAFNKRGAYGTEEAQKAIATLNKSLEAYYKNPDYTNTSKAAIDSLIANQLRKGLDMTIENATDPGYQQFKNQYGALRTIEKDVVHRAIIDARKNVKGLIDFSDVLSAGEVVKGLASMQPGSMAMGSAMKAASLYYKYLNNPNTAIKRMFQMAEKYQNQKPSIINSEAGFIKVPDLGGSEEPPPKGQGAVETPKTTHNY